MANTKGIRIYQERSTAGTQFSWATKDVSSLAIIAPFSITIRTRAYELLSNTQDDVYCLIAFEYGGASDDLYHHAGFGVLDRDTDRIFTDTNRTGGIADISLSPQTQAYTREDWLWIQADVESDRDLVAKLKNDNTTTKPSSWDATKTHSVAIDATVDQELQTVGVIIGLAGNTTASIRGIFEVDEIYVEQN